MQSRVGIAGASIGANLAVLEAAGRRRPSPASPCSRPRSTTAGCASRRPSSKYGSRPALLVSSDDDPYATRSVHDLQKAGGGTREAVVLSQAGHGTVMLSRDQDLARMLVDWFRRTLL